MASPKNPVTGRFVRTLPAFANGGDGKCRAPDCKKTARPFSYYCNVHDKRLRTTGDVEGRLPRVCELAPYRETVRVAFDLGLDLDPRVLALFEWFALAMRVRCADQVHQKHLDRLLVNGVTGQEVAEAVLAVVGLQAHYYGGNVCEAFRELTPKNYRVAIGNAWLRTAPLPKKSRNWATGKDRGQKAPSAGQMARFGDKVVEQIHGPLLQVWQTCLALYEAEKNDPLSVYFRADPLRPDAPRIPVGDVVSKTRRRKRIRRDLPPGHVSRATTLQPAPVIAPVLDEVNDLDGFAEQLERDRAAKHGTE